MTTTARVIVVIPCYNSSRYLGQAIHSVLAQTYRDRQLIVVNDGSTDDFDTAAAPFRDAAVILNQNNCGLAAARNLAIDESDSEYVAFLDADDWWHTDKMAQQVRFLENHPEIPLVQTAVHQVQDGRIIEPRRSYPIAEGWCLDALVAHNTVTTSSVLVRRGALGAAPFARGIQGVEDWDLWLRIAELWRFGLLREPLTFYRVHAANMSSRTNQMLTGSIAVLDRLIARCPGPSIARKALHHRGGLMLALGHAAYERGEFAAARRLYRRGMRHGGPTELVRYTASLLPRAIGGPARRWWGRRTSDI